MRLLTLTVLLIALVNKSSAAPQSAEEEEKGQNPHRADICQPHLCRLPDCRCASTELGGDIAVKDIPQLVMVTFDDAITISNYEYAQTTVARYLNPDGCNGQATFYVSHEYTDYTKVHELWSQGHEIALHSITHSPYSSYWANLTQDEYYFELADQREMMAHFAKIPIDDIKGVRVPLFQLSGENSYRAMADAGLEYDSSWPTSKYVNPGLWPYTLDYYSTQDCSLGSCPEESVKGIWVQPILTWEDQQEHRCAMVDACQNIPDNNVNSLTEWMKKNFHRIYDSNRAPFGFHLHAAWFQKGANYLNAFKNFLDYIEGLGDVYLVKTSKVIDYVKKPVTESKFDSCAETFKPNCNPRNCALMKTVDGITEQRWMQSCINCPRVYPWLHDPFGEGLDSAKKRRQIRKKLH